MKYLLVCANLHICTLYIHAYSDRKVDIKSSLLNITIFAISRYNDRTYETRRSRGVESGFFPDAFGNATERNDE